ncbi:hypothetical protein PHMEG_00021219 [Phytophthora megakarya]|uniref:Uncharacterized protein n=1 Tax=Phytophthora megakarya TaxID=4795 RepID=A0A225VM62_9STRA|nr:hypothetical protein PHMEG_00021219 [Phytophthora megakarya]
MFAWFSLKAEDIALLDWHGKATNTTRHAVSMAIRLKSSKANESGQPGLRMLNRSGLSLLRPEFGAVWLRSGKHRIQCHRFSSHSLRAGGATLVPSRSGRLHYSVPRVLGVRLIQTVHETIQASVDAQAAISGPNRLHCLQEGLTNPTQNWGIQLI